MSVCMLCHPRPVTDLFFGFRVSLPIWTMWPPVVPPHLRLLLNLLLPLLRLHLLPRHRPNRLCLPSLLPRRARIYSSLLSSNSNSRAVGVGVASRDSAVLVQEQATWRHWPTIRKFSSSGRS